MLCSYTVHDIVCDKMWTVSELLKYDIAVICMLKILWNHNHPSIHTLNWKLYSRSRPNKADLSVCPPIRTYVRPSTKQIFRFEQNCLLVHVNEWYTTVCRMTRFKVKVTGLKCAKWQISKAIGEICVYTPRQYLNFKWIDFWYSSSFSVMWPSTVGCFTFGKWILPLTGSRWACWAYLLFCSVRTSFSHF